MSWHWLYVIPVAFSLYEAYKLVEAQRGFRQAEQQMQMEIRRLLLELEHKRYAAAAGEFTWEQEQKPIERIMEGQ